jgi:hypothetical protein
MAGGILSLDFGWSRASGPAFERLPFNTGFGLRVTLNDFFRNILKLVLSH